MQFSTIIVALFAGVTIAAPSAPIEARQNGACDLCRKDCFFTPGSNAAYEGCIASCNSGLGCSLTP
ncbi:hypothetical protein Micbo1qcDRAFT_209842 [Microdochium bolleyi]|uniref:Uncharacterized protein n=1 Tax=Microdochium bolleyi TaxID=196109 RepID=A0A136IKX2_9PEZI|nr:hypothetical protein Micbo1qcDRAFT_209842 [Microdochium bolleyi]